MSLVIALDAGPLGLVTHRQDNEQAQACRQWLGLHISAGAKIIVPAVADYEVRRELIRSGKNREFGAAGSIRECSPGTISWADGRIIPARRRALGPSATRGIADRRAGFVGRRCPARGATPDIQIRFGKSCRRHVESETYWPIPGCAGLAQYLTRQTILLVEAPPRSSYHH